MPQQPGNVTDLNQMLAGMDNPNNQTSGPSGGGFNWGTFLGTLLPGVAGLFGIGSQNNTNDMAAIMLAEQERRRRQTNTIIWIVILAVVVGLLIWFSRKGK